MTAGGFRRVALGTVLVAAALGGALLASGSTGVVSGDAIAADGDNEAPLADAGLDQEVPVNATVYLDASGSRDPDGSIESYEWTVERPDGNRTNPVCEDCARTEFRVTMNGTYEVTVTVTDDDGATSSDTLYVTATAVDGPSIELSGPERIAPGVNTTYTASATAGDSPLQKVEWARNGSQLADRDISGQTATDDLTVNLEPGTYTLTARVVSDLGRTDTATLTIIVADRPAPPCDSAVWNETAAQWDVDPCDEENDDEDEEWCYNDQSERAEEWEKNHPTKQFACYNDVWFGGLSPAIVNTNEDNWFNAKGVKVDWSTAQEWTNHSDVSLSTDSGFERLNFATVEVWKNVSENDDPRGPGDENPPENGPPKDNPPENEPPENDPPEENPPDEKPPGTSCDNFPIGSKPPFCQ